VVCFDFLSLKGGSNVHRERERERERSNDFSSLVGEMGVLSWVV
jgi:hypothetical protein